MQITQRMFESYLYCPVKCFQCRDGPVGQVTEFSEWQRQRQSEYEQAAWTRLCASFPADMTFWGNPAPSDLRSHRYRLIGHCEISTPELQARLNGIQLKDFKARTHHQKMYAPVRFVASEKLRDKDRLCLAFDALALSSISG